MTYKKRFFGPADDRDDQMARVVLAIVFSGLAMGLVLMWWD